MSDLSEQSRIDELFQSVNMAEVEIRAYAMTMLEKAAQAGRWLLELKEIIPPGQFYAECDKRCSIKKSQRGAYIRLARNYEALPKGRYTGLLSINEALAYLTLDDESKKSIDARIESGETLQKREIERLNREAKAAKKALEDERQAREQLRQENLIKNAEIRELKNENKTLELTVVEVQKTKAYPIYEFNDDKAAEAADLLAKKRIAEVEHKAKLAEIERDRIVKEKADIAAEKQRLEGSLKDSERELRHAGVAAVEAFKKNHADEYEKLKNREFYLRQSVDQLMKQQTEIENTNNFLHDHRAAMKEFRQALFSLEAIACVIDEPCNSEEINNQWMKLLGDGMQMLNDIAAKVAPKAKLAVIADGAADA